MDNYFDNSKTAEILAPAGSLEVFKAVLAAGADAVYLGGNRFGARAYAGNLSDSEILDAIDYAHIHGKKMYLTVNTLVKNSELCALYEYLKPFYEAGLDAVIVQDYGVMKLISECFPALDIHASTQMTITHKSYIDFLRAYNVTRIVPARELSLEELKKLHAYDGKMELECFVHGALCYSYSGQCLISSFLGGRSGNRGRCAGTCRLMYEAKGDRRALLSLKDLCALEILPEILDAGVYSLKIEGRMKSAEYAAGVTSIYRRYVDMYLSGQDYRVDEKDIKNLLMLFDRGGMTKGYFFTHNGAGMIADSDKADKSQAQKNDYENLIKSQYVGKNLKEKINVSVKLFEGKPAILSLTDKAGNSVSVCGERVERALSRPLSREDIEKQISKFGNTDYEAESIETEMKSDENIFMPNKALNELRRQAVEALNNARLAAYRRADAKPFTAAQPQNGGKSSGRKNASDSGDGGFSPRISVRAMTAEQAYAALRAGADRLCLETELMSLEETAKIRGFCAESGTDCFLAMPRIMREGRTSFIEDNMEFLRNLKFDGFLIRNMAEYEYMRKNGFEGHFTADYTMYAFNDKAVRALEECGFSEIVYPVELNSGELAGLCAQAERELIVYMRTPLMISAGCIDRTVKGCHAPESGFGIMRDRKRAKLKYLCCCKYCYNIIYNSVPTVLTDRISEIKRLDPEYLGLAFADETAGQVESAVRDARGGLQTDFAQGDASCGGFTRGHFTHGVE